MSSEYLPQNVFLNIQNFVIAVIVICTVNLGWEYFWFTGKLNYEYTGYFCF